MRACVRAYVGVRSYIPGGDVCGVVEAVADGDETFVSPGDCVVAQFHQNRGGLAEYALVKTSQCALKPECLTPSEAAATGSSGAAAVSVAQGVNAGDRVLVLGGAGGVGTFVVQLVKARGAAFVAATSTQTDLLRDLGVDRPIDYREVDVWTLPEFQAPVAGNAKATTTTRATTARNNDDGGGALFDVVIDLAHGDGWDDGVRAPHSMARPIVKSGTKGGRFLTTVPPAGKWPQAQSYWAAAKVFALAPLARTVSSWFVRWNRPRYKFVFGVSGDVRGKLEELFGLVESGDVRVVLHGGQPFPFTSEGVREAIRVQESGHAHGKVVVKISD